MSIDNISAGNWWNYSKRDGENFVLGIQGEIIEIAEVQTFNHRTNQFEFWPVNPMTGVANPKLDLRLRILQENGAELLHSFNPKGPEARALQQAYKTQFGRGLTRWSDLLGEVVAIATSEGSYSQNNPRPWTFNFLGKGTHGGEYIEFDMSKMQAPQQQQQPVYQGQPYMQPPQIAQPQGYYQQQPQPMPQPMPVQQPMQQPMQQAPMAQPVQMPQQPIPAPQPPLPQQNPFQQQPAPMAMPLPPDSPLYQDDIPF